MSARTRAVAALSCAVITGETLVVLALMAQVLDSARASGPAVVAAVAVLAAAWWAVISWIAREGEE